MRVIQDFVFQELSCLADRESRHIGLPGSVGAGTERRHVCILYGDHMHHFHRDADHVGRHLGESRVRALADLRLAQLQLEGTVLIQHHPAG